MAAPQERGSSIIDAGWTRMMPVTAPSSLRCCVTARPSARRPPTPTFPAAGLPPPADPLPAAPGVRQGGFCARRRRAQGKEEGQLCALAEPLTVYLVRCVPVNVHEHARERASTGVCVHARVSVRALLARFPEKPPCIRARA
jgi:hypothetical protein